MIPLLAVFWVLTLSQGPQPGDAIIGAFTSSQACDRAQAVTPNSECVKYSLDKPAASLPHRRGETDNGFAPLTPR